MALFFLTCVNFTHGIFFMKQTKLLLVTNIIPFYNRIRFGFKRAYEISPIKHQPTYSINIHVGINVPEVLGFLYLLYSSIKYCSEQSSTYAGRLHYFWWKIWNWHYPKIIHLASQILWHFYSHTGEYTDFRIFVVTKNQQTILITSKE